jgi:hypothetical protein
MILPAKHLPQERSLAGIGADVLAQLDEGRTVSELWERVRAGRASTAPPLSYDWFILALTMLYALSAVDFDDNIVSMRRVE